MLANGIQVVFGSASFISASVDEVAQWLNAFDDLGIKTIDTAPAYGVAEEALGQAGAAKRFIIDTKHNGGFGQEPATKDRVIAEGKASLQKLQTDSVDVYCIHTPDRRVPWKETLAGLDALHKQGAFRRLGLSNFLADEVEEVVRIAKENSFVVPSVYQGNYNAVARRTEDEIIPVLRRHGIAFYAYSPIAGGFLSKSKAELVDPEGRFGEKNPLSGVYNGMYNRPTFVEALGVWEEIAKDEGVSRAELAYRWVAYHSKLRGEFGDAIVVGARREDQLRETVAAMQRGPLSEKAVKRIEEVWESVKADAWLDNWEMQYKA